MIRRKAFRSRGIAAAASIGLLAGPVVAAANRVPAPSYGQRVDAAIGSVTGQLARAAAIKPLSFEMLRGPELAAMTARLEDPALDPRERERIVGEGSRIIRHAFIASQQSWALDELSLKHAPPRLRRTERGVRFRERYGSAYEHRLWDVEGHLATLRAAREIADSAPRFFEKGKKRARLVSREQLEEALAELARIVESGELERVRRDELEAAAAWDGIVLPMIAFEKAARGP